MTLILLMTVAVFAVVMLIMAVGVMLSGRCLRGSCGGPEVLGADGESLSCAACPRRKQRQAAQASAESASQESLPILG